MFTSSTESAIAEARREAEEYARRDKFPSEAAQRLLTAQQAEWAAKCQKLDAMHKAAIEQERKTR